MTDCTKHRTEQGKSHRFDQDSGWCVHGCGCRDDGLMTTIAGNPLRAAPNPAHEQPDLLADLERSHA